MVLLFIVSVCANEKFYSLEMGKPRLVVGVIFWLGLSLMIGASLGFEGSYRASQFSLLLYQGEVGVIFIILMLVLVLCLIGVVKISKIESGPLIKRLYFNSLN